MGVGQVGQQPGACITYGAAVNDLMMRFESVRSLTEALAAPLSTEDCCVQSMPEASPTKWHLAHTSWFFETFLLSRTAFYRPFDPRYAYLFNSYYDAVGDRQPRERRGLLTRPSLAEVVKYRRYVTENVLSLIESRYDQLGEALVVLELGVQHEQQHQELILTDIKHLLAQNPHAPAYNEVPLHHGGSVAPLCWVSYAGGLVSAGHDSDGFTFDNELPPHRVYLEPYELATRLVTNREYLEFIRDNGYRRPELWLSEGFRTLSIRNWAAPLYWTGGEDHPRLYSLSGENELSLDEPVCHVSYFEADAFARWSGARLPTEFEWEHAASQLPVTGCLLDIARLHPRPAVASCTPLLQVFGDTWEWTASAYMPYPGYRPLAGALGEYNAKFMCNQMVLRGGSCATPADHIRPTYRNFFPADARWQFTGIRLARTS